MPLDTKSVPFSKTDKARSIELPTVLTENLAEEVGMHIGDGSMNKYNSYLYSLRGSLEDDADYYNGHVTLLYKKLYNLEVNIRKWPDVIGFQAGSMALCLFKHRVIGLPLGHKTGIMIPKLLFKNKKLRFACLRGIFDTDGGMYVQKNGYPRIEISTTSRPLFKQLRCIVGEEFNHSWWKREYTNPNWKPLFKLCVRGHKNIHKWFRVVGSNNPKHIRKYKRYSAAVA